MMKKLICVLIITVSIFSIMILPANAAVGYAGYAVYRDGVAFGLEWHGAILITPSFNSAYSGNVVHANMDKVTSLGDYESFLNTHKFIGVYKPKTAISDTIRDRVCYTAKQLTYENISYFLAGQIDYPNSCFGSWVKRQDIRGLRCDGVVEYSYEWNDIKIYGNQIAWNISWGSAEHRGEHCLAYITPKKQAQEYMYKINVPDENGVPMKYYTTGGYK